MGHLNGSVKWADKFDIKANTWTALPDADHKRDHFHGAVINNKIYAASGRRTGEGGPLIEEWPTEGTVDDFNISSRNIIQLCWFYVCRCGFIMCFPLILLIVRY